MSYYSKLEKQCYQLEAENDYLRSRLEEVKKEYSDFVSKMANTSSYVTNSWVTYEVLSGNLQLK